MEVMELVLVGWLDLQDVFHCVQIHFPIVMYGDGVCCCLHATYIVKPRLLAHLASALAIFERLWSAPLLIEQVKSSLLSLLTLWLLGMLHPVFSLTSVRAPFLHPKRKLEALNLLQLGRCFAGWCLSVSPAPLDTRPSIHLHRYNWVWVSREAVKLSFKPPLN